MNDKQIDTFNDWYKKSINQEGAFLGCKTVFRSEHAVIAAKAWQAAIASVVVELPRLRRFMSVSELKEKITKAGIRYE